MQRVIIHASSFHFNLAIKGVHTAVQGSAHAGQRWSAPATCQHIMTTLSPSTNTNITRGANFLHSQLSAPLMSAGPEPYTRSYEFWCVKGTCSSSLWDASKARNPGDAMLVAY